MPKPKVRTISLEDLVEDEENANAGTERGFSMLADSVGKFGAARSLVVDKNGRLVAGNKTREALVNAGITHAVVVETDGHTPVVVKRPDWDLTDKEGAARKYAFYDNRVGELDLQWDVAQIQADLAEGVDLSGLFSEAELSALLEPKGDTEPPEDFDSFDDDIETEHTCPKCGYEWSGKS